MTQRKRFCRSTLASCALQVIANLKVFLEVSPPQTNGNAWLSHDDQLHLYGAVGLLIVSGPDSPAVSVTSEKAISAGTLC